MLFLSQTLRRNRIRLPIALMTLVAALFFFIVLPQPAHAQFGLAGIISAANAVISTITYTIGPLLQSGIGILNGINKVTQAFSDLWQTVVYPRALINRAL